MNTENLTAEQIEVLLTSLGTYKLQMERTEQFNKAQVASNLIATIKQGG